MSRFSKLHFPNAPQIVTPPPGPKAKGLLEKQKAIESKAVLYPLSIPLVLDEAKGATVRDVDGNTYIDFFAGIAVANFGHSNPYILDRVKAQLDKLTHALDFPNNPRCELVEKLINIAPGGLKGCSKVLFGGPTGSDAVEGAIKLAKYYTRRYCFIAFEGSYHGQTAMSLTLSSTRKFKEPYVPLVAEIHFLPYPYCYRCVFNLEYPKCSFQCVNYVEHVLDDPYSGIPKPAAIIVEPIQGEGGIVVPPDEFLSRLRDVASKYDVLLIVDEIQTGFGRTGKMFACEYSNITPDIVTMAKAIGGVGLPLSAVVYSERLDVWGPGAHLGTFRGHVLAMAAGAAAIDFILENDLLAHAKRMGERILNGLRDLAKSSKYIGEVRGKGLMVGVEFVKDKESKKPWKEIVDKIQIECFKRGLIVWKAGHYGNILRLLPPLVVTEELVDKGLEIISDTVQYVEKSFSS